MFDLDDIIISLVPLDKNKRFSIYKHKCQLFRGVNLTVSQFVISFKLFINTHTFFLRYSLLLKIVYSNQYKGDVWYGCVNERKNNEFV